MGVAKKPPNFDKVLSQTGSPDKEKGGSGGAAGGISAKKGDGNKK